MANYRGLSLLWLAFACVACPALLSSPGSPFVAEAAVLEFQIEELCPEVANGDLAFGVNCTVESRIQVQDWHTIYFTTGRTSVPDYGILVELISLEGNADLDLRYSNGFGFRAQPVTSTPDEEDFFVPNSQLRGLGRLDWVVIVKSTDRRPVRYSLTITAAPSNITLHPTDDEVIQNVMEQCCPEDDGSMTSTDPCLYLRTHNSSRVDLCNAPGVVCDTDGHLTTLLLQNQDMSCAIPEELGSLTSLRVLDLSTNKITGSMQAVSRIVESLPDLQSLHLQGNQLTGPLPCSLAAPERLSALLLSDNNITGPIPDCIVNKPGLGVLELRGTQVFGPLPELEAGAVEQLRILDVSSPVAPGGLTGTIPNMRSAVSLHTLLLDDNDFSGSLPELPESIQELRVGSSRLTGSIPADYGELSHLIVLDAAGNRLSGEIPAGLRQLPSLTVLDLRGNRLSGRLGEDWNTPNLAFLLLDSNDLSGHIPGSIVSPWMVHLDLANNQLSGTLDALAEAAANQTVFWTTERESRAPLPFHRLHLQNNSLSGEVPDAFAATLLFTPTRFTTQSSAGRLRDLVEVAELQDNQLSGEWPAWMVADIMRFPSHLAVNMSGNLLECPQAGIDPAVLEAAAATAWETLSKHSCFNATIGQMQLLSDLPVASVSEAAPEEATVAPGEGGESGGSDQVASDTDLDRSTAAPDTSGAGSVQVATGGSVSSTAGSESSTGDDDDSDDGMGTGAIIAIAVSAAIVAAALAVVVAVLLLRQRSKSSRWKDMESEMAVGPDL